MGSDGLEGARTIRHAGGVVLAQDEATSAVWGMPGRVTESGIAALSLPLSALAREVNVRVNTDRVGSAGLVQEAAKSLSPRQEVAHGLL
jgi:two-component system chemotaxis response regulator CheB